MIFSRGNGLKESSYILFNIRLQDLNDLGEEKEKAT